MPGLEMMQPFIVSLLIGLLIGIERERSHPRGTQALGVRSFTLIALLGTLSAYLHDPSFKIILLLFVLSGILLSYYRSTAMSGEHRDVGITTEFSAAIVFCLGFLALTKPYLAGSLGVI